MILKKKKTAPGKTASQKAAKRERTRELDDDFADFDPDGYTDADDEDEGREPIFKFAEGKNRIVILPPLKSWGLRYPWKKTGTHYVGQDIENIIGEELPDGIPTTHGCPFIENGDADCGWCRGIAKLKASRSRKDRNLAYALRANPRYCANIVNLNADEDERYVQIVDFGATIYKVLYSFLRDKRVNFANPRALIPISILRRGTGKGTKYPEKQIKLLRDKAFPIDPAWKSQMVDLNSRSAPISSNAEIEDWLEQLVSGPSSGYSGGDDDDEYDDDDINM